jgi:hypothetical protein
MIRSLRPKFLPYLHLWSTEYSTTRVTCQRFGCKARDGFLHLPPWKLLILDPGLAEPWDPESLASQVDDSWHASMLASQVSWAVTEVQPTPSPIFSISRKSVCSEAYSFNQVTLSIFRLDYGPRQQDQSPINSKDALRQQAPASQHFTSDNIPPWEPKTYKQTVTTAITCTHDQHKRSVLAHKNYWSEQVISTSVKHSDPASKPQCEWCQGRSASPITAWYWFYTRVIIMWINLKSAPATCGDCWGVLLFLSWLTVMIHHTNLCKNAA